MSTTPDMFYHGKNACSLCDKPMFVNDHGVTYRPNSSKQGDKMFCASCAIQLVMSVGQDLMRMQPEVAFNFYQRFKHPGAAAANLRRHAMAMHNLSGAMTDWAAAISWNSNPEEK